MVVFRRCAQKKHRISKNNPCFLPRGMLNYLLPVTGQFDGKEVNKSNEGRNPSQLSADYYSLRLR